jgi:hypothetical protein
MCGRKHPALDPRILFSFVKFRLTTLPNSKSAFIDLFPDSTPLHAGIDLFKRLVVDKNLSSTAIATDRLSVISSTITVSDSTGSPI